MAVHGIKATLQLGAVTLTGYVSSVTADLRRELAEARLLGATGVHRVPGLQDCSFTVEGASDNTILGNLLSAFASDSPATLTFKPLGNTGPTLTCSVYASLNLNASAGDVSRFTLNLASDGAVTVS